MNDETFSVPAMQPMAVRGATLVMLEEIATEMYQGSGIRRDQLTDTGTACVRYNELYTTFDTWFDRVRSYTDVTKIRSPKYFSHGDILLTITSGKAEDIAKACAYVGPGDCLAGDYVVVMKHEQNPKYLAYALGTNIAGIQKRAGSVESKIVVRTSLAAIGKIIIPLPPLPEQDRLVAILDSFHALVTDLSGGIPGEIVKRSAQLEYYRDKLMQFKRKPGTDDNRE